MSSRAALREALAGAEPFVAPVCLDPLSARVTERLGFRAAYLSGGGLGYALAVSEALLTVTEVATLTRQITQRSSIPLIVDGGVGFGDALHATRAVWELEAAGAAAIEIEDQVAPKRAHHHKGVEHLIPAEEMAGKVAAAAEARRDPDLILIARTGAVRHEGVDAAIERGRAYLAAGADALLIFPSNEDEMRRIAAAIDAPLVMMTLSSRWPPDLLRECHAPLVIDPFSGQVLQYQALRDAYAAIAAGGRPSTPPEDLMRLYREMHDEAGMELFYGIEERTTEKPQ